MTVAFSTVRYVPFALGHSVEPICREALVILELFRSDHRTNLALNQCVALTPAALARAHLRLDDRLFPVLHEDQPIVVRA